MKKILSILSFTLLFVGIMWGKETVTLTINIEGQGRVHVTDATIGDESAAKGYPNVTSTSFTDSHLEMDKGSGWLRYWENTYSINAFAYPNTGHYFEQWKDGNKQIGTEEKMPSYSGTVTSADIFDGNRDKTYTAVFKEQVVYKNYAHVQAVLVDKDNKPLLENGFYTTGACYVSIGNTEPKESSGLLGEKEIIRLNSNPSGTWDYQYNASANDNNYEFLGWYEADAEGNLILTNDGKVDEANKVLINGTPAGKVFTKTYPTSTSYSDRANAPIARALYAVFKPKFYLFPYDAEKDQFKAEPMTQNVNAAGIFQYEDRITTKVGERLYKIEHFYDATPTVCRSEGDFEGRIETIQGMDVLRVNPTNNATELSGTIKLCVGETEVVHLFVSATNEPIYVYLNPAEGFLGTYTYTQNTTGTQTFQVTTSQIVKKMMTSTDYAFTFNPTPSDPSKTMFEKWVIKDAEDKVIYESENANLAYRFDGGESITPIFTSKDRAIFIVKSEPHIKYLKLQEALDHAAELTETTGQKQVVVVYTTNPPTGQTNAPVRLVQGEYTIDNGVTLLIPGESTFDVLEAPDGDNYSITQRTMKPFCTLVVDDNTTITVKDGNISLYALMGADQGAVGTAGRVYNHGHMQLGKNCQIVFEKGNLYALGFITGDMSSHITMKSGTTTYESFQFKDWRGGGEVLDMKDNREKVFPVGQYYVQTVEVPITFESGAVEYLSTAVVVSGALLPANVKFIDKYNPDDDLGLFCIDDGATLTKVYNPATDRLKFEFKGESIDSQVKIGHLRLRMRASGGIASVVGNIDVDSKDYVMPIQNNMDLDVMKATINITSDVAYMPGSTMRVYDNARINVGSGVRMYIYDRDARYTDAGLGYWGAYNTSIIPLSSDARPGGIQYKRTDADLVDARLIINGDMNIYGELYTVKGATDILNGAGADITSEGSGKINVYNIGTDQFSYQWEQGDGAKTVSLTSPNSLILHNDISKQPEGNKFEYTPVVNENEQNLATNPLSYTYYQHDGTWKLPEAGITGIKLYDSQDNEIEKFLITNPTVTSVNGYILATLEPKTDVEYQLSDFHITLGDGQYPLNDYASMTDDGKLKVLVTYPVQKIHGDHVQTLRITNTQKAEFSCDIVVDIKATEDYTPIFEVPSSLNILGRIGESTNAALPIKHDADNVVVISTTIDGNPKWEATVEGTGNAFFDFALGEESNELAGAKVVFTPNDGQPKSATLKLKAIYTDQEGNEIPSEEHIVKLTGSGLMIDNTLTFNNVGTITTKTSPFELLAFINSEGKIYYEIVEGAVNEEIDAVIDITPVDANDANGNYMIAPKRDKVGQVKIRVRQEGTATHTAVGMTFNTATGEWENSDEGAIEKTIVVVADPESLTADNSCVEEEGDFLTLTADLNNVVYVEGEGDNPDQIQFVGDGSSMWTAQFSSMPGTLTFTPHGDGYWSIIESKDGVDWSEIIWQTQLPDREPMMVALHPTSRRVRIIYNKENEIGYVTNLCVNPFTVHTDASKLYVPLIDGSVKRTEVVFTHVTPSMTISGPAWATAQESTDNLGGVLNTYYQTTVILEGKNGETKIEELNNGFELTATTSGLANGEKSASLTISTYDFPKRLPIQSTDWQTNDNIDVNGYDESEHYYWYMVSAEYVKWDAERNNVVFLSKGTNESAAQRVVFGYDGLPSEVRFQSLSTEWLIEESIDNTWPSGDITPTHTVTTDENGVSTITQSINHTSKYVRITYMGNNPEEVLLSNLVIEGFPSAVPNCTELEISKGDDPSVTPSATFNIHVMNLDKMALNLDNTTEFKMYYYYQTTDDGSWVWVPLANSDILDTQFRFLAMNEKGDITIKVEWIGQNMVNEGLIQILDPESDKVLSSVRLVGKKSAITAADANTGIWTGVPDGKTKGRPTPDAYNLVGSTGDNKVFEPYPYHEVNIANAFDDKGNALFNYLIIYGETTTKDGKEKIISRPDKNHGSNAKTPYYIYERSQKGDSYNFIQAVENANNAQKANLSEISHFEEITVGDAKYYAIKPRGGQPLSMYITGFCPYATTGSTKDDEGVWYFQGEVGDQLHIYLEDCHIYSRNKSVSGHNTSKNGEDSPYFNDVVVKGSGAVLVFENASNVQDSEDPFNVYIHTRGHNILKSNYGCYYQFIGTMQATQISSPIQVRVGSEQHFMTSRTTVDFDDIWPVAISDRSKDERTNGFLSLQKLANNAPSIDLGNAHTEVNFRGGQIQMENATIGSPNYKTTLAISYRSGKMGNIGIQMAYGIGTDDVGGRVNFYDGTTTVLPMTVPEEYRSYYLMDTEQAKDADGKPKVDAEGKPVMVDAATTSCLRTPTETYVYGGSHCMMRACNHVTSKGGAPRDANGVSLGRYVYNNSNSTTPRYYYQCVETELPEGDLYERGYREGYELICNNERYIVDLANNSWTKIGPAPATHPCFLVTPTEFPGELQYKGAPLKSYYEEKYPINPLTKNGEYGLSSITPDANGNLSFWIPDGVVEGVSPEKDKQISAWKACITEIIAGHQIYKGSIGGSISVEHDEEIKNLLYCQLDNNIYNVIHDRQEMDEDESGNPIYDYSYSPPVVDPTGQMKGDDRYQTVDILHIGDSLQHSIVSDDDYMVSNKIYYITTAQADKWMNFTMPFDVEKVWIVESYSEDEIEKYFKNFDDSQSDNETKLSATLKFQARHNADFATFFGVAMAIGNEAQKFEDIYNTYMEWAEKKADKENGLYDKERDGKYNLRGMYSLTHYNGDNFTSANFFLYKNNGNWTKRDEGNREFTANWQIVPKVPKGGVLMEAGESYSLLFPYCLGCDVIIDDEGNMELDDKTESPKTTPRDYWDYWSGKFLIFESTEATEKDPHVIKGAKYVKKEKIENEEWIFDNLPTATTAKLTGNPTFTMLHIDDDTYASQVYVYDSEKYYEGFYPIEQEVDDKNGNEITDEGEAYYPAITPTTTFLLNGHQARASLITRDGKIVYDKSDDDNNGNQNGTSGGGHMPTVGGGNDLFITAIEGGINIAVAEPQMVKVMSSTGAVLFAGYVTTATDVQLPTHGIYIVSGENEVQKIMH